MNRLLQEAAVWLNQARARLAAGQFSSADLDALEAVLNAAPPRQRLLYLPARGPSIYAPVMGLAEHEPVAGQAEATLRTRGEMAYRTVHAAVVDGWHIVHFPEQSLSFESGELEYIGYQFILQKIEFYSA